MRRSR